MAGGKSGLEKGHPTKGVRLGADNVRRKNGRFLAGMRLSKACQFCYNDNGKKYERIVLSDMELREQIWS